MAPVTPPDGAVTRWAQLLTGPAESPSAGAAATHSPASASVAPSSSEQRPDSDCSSPKASRPAAPSGKSAAESSDVRVKCSLANGDRGVGSEKKKHAWNKPSNGAIASPSEAGPSVVLGGPDSWPDLSEAAKAKNKASSSCDLSSSSKSLADAPVSDSQGVAKGKSSNRPSSSSSGNPNSTQNHSVPVRQRSMRRGSGVPSARSTISNPSPSQAPPVSLPLPSPAPAPPVSLPLAQPQAAPVSLPLQPHFPSYRGPLGDAYGNFIPMHQMPDYGHGQFQRPPYQPRWENDTRNHHRRGNYGYHNGNGANQNNNYGHRRENNRGYNGQPRRGPPPPPPLPHSVGYFAQTPPPLSPHGQFYNYTGFPNYVHPYRPVQYMTASPPPMDYMTPSPPPMDYTSPSPPPMTDRLPLPERIAGQVDYYFGDVNLATDFHLQGKMNLEGWVSVDEIAKFRRVQEMTSDKQLILNSVDAHSTQAEVKGDMVRKRNTWMNFLRPSNQSHSMAAPSSKQELELPGLEGGSGSGAYESQVSGGELAPSS